MSARQHLITDKSLQASLDWLRDHAKDMGAAKERMVRAEHMTKHIEAIEFQKSDAKSADARKADARASKAYRDAFDEEAQAAGAYEVMRSLREAAALKIEAWRTEQANYRAMKI